MKEISIFSDINLNWIPHPLIGDVTPYTNADAIKQSLKNLFFLRPFDVPFNANCYSHIQDYLFEPITEMTASNLKKRLEWMIETFEKRIKIHSIDIDLLDSENGFEITLVYRIRALSMDDSFKHFFQRIR